MMQGWSLNSSTIRPKLCWRHCGTCFGGRSCGEVPETWKQTIFNMLPKTREAKSTKPASRTSMPYPPGPAQKQSYMPSWPTRNSTPPAPSFPLMGLAPTTPFHATACFRACRCLPFVRLFYTQPSTYVWQDNTNTPHLITQAEGGEQGDPLMPALFSLGQHAAIQAAHSQLQAGESLFAYLDDIYAIVEPDRVKPVYDLLAHHLYTHAHIQLNSGKTRVWNAAGVPPPNLEPLGPDVWVADPALPLDQQGLTVLGAPLGTAEYQQHFLRQTRTGPRTLLENIPCLDDLQASWLLLLYCASPGCNYLLRMLPPNTPRQYAQEHDLAVLTCLTTLLDTANVSRALTPPLGRSGPHLRHRHSSPSILGFVGRHHAHTHRQAPQQATAVLQQLQAEAPATPSIQALTQALEQLQHHGFASPSWADLAQGSTPPTQPDPEPRPPEGGWQRPAALASHQAFRTELMASLAPQPGHAPVPVRSIRQPCFHRRPFWTRYQLSFPPLPCPAPQTPSSPIAPVSTCLSAPSHSRPTRRPSRSMRPGRGFTGERGLFGTSSSSSLSGSRSPGYKQHPA